MSIKNQNGSVFSLAKPNPLMLEQDQWVEGEKMLIHNLGQAEEVRHEDKHIDERVESVIQSIIIPKAETISQENKLVAWCLPAHLHVQEDPLYGEKKQWVTYGEKFSFETVILKRMDYYCELWSPTLVPNLSIIYLWGEREWWKVSTSRQDAQGRILCCFPSETQPSFN